MTDAIVTSDMDAVKAALPSEAMAPNDLITVLRNAVDAADMQLNSDALLKREFRRFLDGESEYNESYGKGWDATKKILNEKPSLFPVFWDVLASALRRNDDFEFKESIDSNLPDWIEAAFKGASREKLVHAFADHVVNNPNGSCHVWIRDCMERSIWKPTIRLLTERLQKREIDAKIFTALMSESDDD
jgi:hypothetical protein